VRFAFLLLLLPAVAFGKSPPIDYHEPPPDPPGSGAIPNAPPIPDRLVRPGPFQNLPAIDESHPVELPSVKQPYWSFGKLDPVLTEACRLGDFASQPINRIELHFVGDTGRARMQVIPPLYRNLLIDRRSLAKPGVTYYFLDTALPDCEVRVDKNVKLNSFAPGRTTALPPFNPRALAAKKAQIKSWPGS
jgi:hypothetical protein